MSVNQCRAVPEQVTVNGLDHYVAGSYVCPECGFVLCKSVLAMSAGKILANIKQEYELCPNDGNPMQPLTYKDAYLAQIKASETIFRVIEHYQTASNDCECGDCDKLADKFRRYATSERSRVIPPPHILKLYDRCCELEEHVAKHTLEDFEHCDICCENGEARKADIAYDNAVIGWVNGLCAAWLRSQEGK